MSPPSSLLHRCGIKSLAHAVALLATVAVAAALLPAADASALPPHAEEPKPASISATLDDTSAPPQALAQATHAQPTSTPPPSPTAASNAVTAGGDHTCGLKTDNTITCWGNNEHGQADAPGGTFNAVTAGHGHTCGLKTDATITCWGNNEHGKADAPGGTFNAVTAGWNYTCGLKTDSTITCWGDNVGGQADAPGGTFNAVTAGANHTCGLKTDATITCWGLNVLGSLDYGQTNAPSGTFNAVTADAHHTCGLKTNATITCWGLNEHGQADAPSGTFNAVTAGAIHTCGLKTDNTITCWGYLWGQIDAPGGTFNAVTAGGSHTCGLKTDATIACWGNNEHGKADAPGGTFGPAGGSGPTVTVTKGGPGPTVLGPGQGVACGANTPTCRYLDVELRGFAAGTYTVSCSHDGWGDFGPSTFWTFPVTVDSSGSASRSGPCFLNFARLTANGAYVTVSENGVEIARSAWLEATPSDVIESPSELPKVTGVRFMPGSPGLLWVLRVPSVTWDEVSDATSFEVEWLTVRGEQERSSVDTGLACCTHEAGFFSLFASQARVRAVNGDGEGPWSAVALKPVKPGKVTGIHYSLRNAMWDAVEGATSYDIVWKFGGENARVVRDLNWTRYGIPQMEGKPIRITVRAVNEEAGPGPWSSWTTIWRPQDDVPLEVRGLDYNNYQISWQPVQGVSQYRIEVEFLSGRDKVRSVSCARLYRCTYDIGTLIQTTGSNPSRIEIKAKNDAGLGPATWIDGWHASKHDLDPDDFDFGNIRISADTNTVDLPVTIGDWGEGKGGQAEKYLHTFAAHLDSQTDRAAAWLLTLSPVAHGDYTIETLIPKRCRVLVVKFDCPDPEPSATVRYNLFQRRSGKSDWEFVGSSTIRQGVRDYAGFQLIKDGWQPLGLWRLEGDVAVVVEDRQAEDGTIAVDTMRMAFVEPSISEADRQQIAEVMAQEAIAKILECVMRDEQAMSFAQRIDWDDPTLEESLQVRLDQIGALCRVRQIACEQGVGQAMGLTALPVGAALRAAATIRGLPQLNNLAHAYEGASQAQVNHIENTATDLVSSRVC